MGEKGHPSHPAADAGGGKSEHPPPHGKHDVGSAVNADATAAGVAPSLATPGGKAAKAVAHGGPASKGDAPSPPSPNPSTGGGPNHRSSPTRRSAHLTTVRPPLSLSQCACQWDRGWPPSHLFLCFRYQL